MKVVIMAGGKGTRISSVVSDIPKPMIKIEGIPVLEREIECLKEQGFDDILITVSHLGNIIMDYFGDGSGNSPVTGQPFGVHIEYYFEREPLGNAGALFKIKDKLTENFLLLNADAMFDVDFNRFVEYHKQHGGLVTLFTHPNSHPYDSGLIIADKNGAVERWLAKEDERPLYYRNRVNAGLHVINPEILALSGIDAEVVGKNGGDGKPVKVDLDRQLLKPLAGTGKMFCYDSPEYVKDMGTPDRYYSVCADYREGRVTGKNLKNKQKAIFLDRDGTINKYVGFLRNIDEFELLDGAAEAIRKINESGYLAIVVTNQPVIARGEVSFDELEEIHNKMETLLGKEGAYLDAIYYCPHHPHKGYDGERPELKIDCDCRKPKPGMLLKAASDFNIDLSQSWMVGDGENDIKAGINNISILSVEGVGFKPYVAICNALNISWVLRTDNDIFSKTSVTPAKKYYAGISRGIGIVKDIGDNKTGLIEYWNQHSKENEWPKDAEIPEEAKKLNEYIRTNIKDLGIFLSDVDLENDLASSELKDTLMNHYGKRDHDDLVNAMQKKKAENMMEFLTKNHKELSCLEESKIVEPLTSLIRITTERTRPDNGERTN